MSCSSRTALGSPTNGSYDQTSSTRTARMRRAFGRMRRLGSMPWTGRGLAMTSGASAGRLGVELLDRDAGVAGDPRLEVVREALVVQPLEQRDDVLVLVRAPVAVLRDQALDAGALLRLHLGEDALEA